MEDSAAVEKGRVMVIMIESEEGVVNRWVEESTTAIPCGCLSWRGGVEVRFGTIASVIAGSPSAASWSSFHRHTHLRPLNPH